MYKLKKVAVVVALIMISGSSVAQAETSCKTKSILPGITTVIATAKGSADQGDFAECTATYQCPAGARKVQVYGVGVSSKPDAVMAVENYAVASDNSEGVVSDCEALARQGRPGRYCTGQVSELQPTNAATLIEAQCTSLAGAPANGKIVATATCICED